MRVVISICIALFLFASCESDGIKVGDKVNVKSLNLPKNAPEWFKVDHFLKMNNFCICVVEAVHKREPNSYVELVCDFPDVGKQVFTTKTGDLEKCISIENGNTRIEW